jgi:alkylation response protein AidB-like acyl-CoA dehydrogenase
VVPEVLGGKKFICLAISEAHAGSDVMGLKTTAVKSEDGKSWIINGGSFNVTWLPKRFLICGGKKRQ